ncbi:hypothetical protein J0H58_29545 [bacterium]|nr:hypothetical protein [bacterium]
MADDKGEIDAAFKAFGTAATDGMYRMMLDRLDAGKDTEAGGVRTLVMSAARYVRDNGGGLRTVEDMRRFAAEVTAARSGGAAALTAVVMRWAPAAGKNQGTTTAAPATAPTARGTPAGAGKTELRPNALLDEAFGGASLPTPPTAGGTPAGGGASVELRPNALLDEAFGGGGSGSNLIARRLPRPAAPRRVAAPCHRPGPPTPRGGSRRGGTCTTCSRRYPSRKAVARPPPSRRPAQPRAVA